MKKRNFYVYILVFVLIAVCSIIYAVKNKPVEDREMIISRESTSDYVLEKYKDGFVTYNGTELIHYDTEMEQKWVCAVNESGAELYINGDYVVLYNTGNNKVILVKNGEILKEIRTDKALRKATVNENGYMVLLTTDKGYKGQCFVYSDKGEMLAQYSFGERYILGAFLDSDNRSLVINAIEDRKEGYGGELIFTDIKTGKTRNEIEAESIYSYATLYKGRVFAMKDGKLYCYGKKGNEKWSYDSFSGEILFIGFSGKNPVVVVKNTESFGGNEVLIFNMSGRLKGIYQAESQVKAFDTSEGYAAINVNGKILLINSRGKMVSELDADPNTEVLKLYKKNDKVLTVSEKAIIQKFKR